MENRINQPEIMKSGIPKKLFYYFSFFIVLLVFIILSPSFGRPFSEMPFLFIPVVFALFVTFIIMLIIDLFRKTRYSWNILFTAITISAALYSGSKIINVQAEQSKQSALPIISSLNKYYSDYNRFPDSIEELKPKYILDIPKSEMGFIGSNFTYKTQENNKDFWLSFEEFNSDKWIYINSRNIWVLDD